MATVESGGADDFRKVILDLSLGRSDAYDTRPYFLRPSSPEKGFMVNQRGNIEYGGGMLEIGSLRVSSLFPVSRGFWRLNLYTATLEGTFHVSMGEVEEEIKFEAFVSGDNLEHPVLAMKVQVYTDRCKW